MSGASLSAADLERLRSRFDLSLRLTSDEVAELTDRVLDASKMFDRDDGQIISLESFVTILEPAQLAEGVIDEAIAGLLDAREQRLSNAIERKAHELERMLLGLLPRLDASFQTSLAIPLGDPGCVDHDVQLRLCSRRFGFDLDVHHHTPGGVSERLFSILVRAARQATIFQRFLERRPRSLPKEVLVAGPFVSGNRLQDLLTWTVLEKNAGSDRGRAASVALSRLHGAVMSEIATSLRYVNELRFDSG